MNLYAVACIHNALSILTCNVNHVQTIAVLGAVCYITEHDLKASSSVLYTSDVVM